MVGHISPWPTEATLTSNISDQYLRKSHFCETKLALLSNMGGLRQLPQDGIFEQNQCQIRNQKARFRGKSRGFMENLEYFFCP